MNEYMNECGKNEGMFAYRQMDDVLLFFYYYFIDVRKTEFKVNSFKVATATQRMVYVFPK